MNTHKVQFIDKDAAGNEVHEYLVDGIRVPSVTYVLDKRGFINYGAVSEAVLAEARERGQIGHEVTAWFDEVYPDVITNENILGNLSDGKTETTAEFLVDSFSVAHLEETLHPWSREILKAWIVFRLDFGLSMLSVEQPMAWKINGMLVCGTPDRIVYSNRLNRRMVIDLKFTAAIESSCKYQLAAYAANQEWWLCGASPDRYIAQFKGGECLPYACMRSKDIQIFSAALAITHDLWNGGGK